MLFSEITQEVKNIIQDSSFDSLVAGYINEALLQAAGRVNIPDLKRVGIAQTIPEQLYVSLVGLPEGFSGRLSKLLTPDIIQFKDIETLVDWVNSQSRSLTEVGAVEAVALEGRVLWYYPSPATEQDISAIVYTNPVILEDADDVPTFLPDHCHRNIAVHGAAYIAYDTIEDGIGDAKVNTTFHYTMFEKGITQLAEWVGRNRVHQITSCMNDGIVV